MDNDFMLDQVCNYSQTISGLSNQTCIQEISLSNSSSWQGPFHSDNSILFSTDVESD